MAEETDNLRVIDLPSLVQLTLAARCYQDFADVLSLIGDNGLDEAFAERLHPSVRADYLLCLDEKRREDEYEARRDQAD